MTYSWKTADRIITNIVGKILLRLPINYSNSNLKQKLISDVFLLNIFLDKHKGTTNLVRQYSMFDSKLQMMSHSTNPKWKKWISRFHFFLLYKTFDLQISIVQQNHSTNNVKIHRNLNSNLSTVVILNCFKRFLPKNKNILPGRIELNRADINIGRVIAFGLRFENTGRQNRMIT